MPTMADGVNSISFERTSEQCDIIDAARTFARERIRLAADQLERALAHGGLDAWTFPDELLRDAGSAGLTCYALPDEFGGGGLDPLTSAMVIEELAVGDAGLASLLTSAQLFGGGVLAAAAGTTVDDVSRTYLTRACATEGSIAAIAFSEPGAGSDVANIVTRAQRTDSGSWRINGEKTWITGGMPHALATLVFARTGGEGASGISAFIVPKDTPGVTFHKLDLLGFRTSWTGQIFFDDVEVPADHLIGGEGNGFAAAMGFFTHSRPQVAAVAVGCARAAFEHAVTYAREREAFGRPIVGHQAVGFLLADMGMRIEAARTLVWRACDLAARGEDVALAGSYAKAFASDVAMQVTTDAVQVLGGAGLSTDHPVQRCMRDAKVLQIVEGTNQIQRLIASRYLAQGAVSLP